MHADRVCFSFPHDIVPLAYNADAPIEQLLDDWKWLSLFFNRVNTAMGKNPLHPFDIPSAVARKLAFMHKLFRETTLKPTVDHLMA